MKNYRKAIPLLIAAVILLPGNRSSQAGQTALEARNLSFELLNEGVKLYKDGKYRDAVQKLQRTAGISLNSFMAQYYLGLSFIGLKKYEEAIPPLQLSVELEPEHIQAHIALANSFLKQGDIPEARAGFLRALEIQEDYAPALEGLGRLHEAIGDNDLAIEYYEQALALNSTYPDTYTSLGDLFLELGNMERGVELFLEAIDIRPDFAPAYHRLAVTYHRQKRYQLAIVAIEAAEERDPNEALYPTLLGEILLELDNPHRGIEKLQRAMGLDPDFPRPFRALAGWYRAQLQLDRSLEILNQALGGEIRDPNLLEETIDERRQYQVDIAELQSLRNVLEESPEEPAHYLSLARLCRRLGAYEKAVSHQKTAMEMMEEPDSLRFDLGYLQTLAGKYLEASRTFEVLAAKNPRDRFLLFNLGVARSGLGDFAGAADAYRTAIEIRAEFPEAHLYLANADFRLGQWDQAAAGYREYLRLVPDGEESLRVREILHRLETRVRRGTAASPTGSASP